MNVVMNIFFIRLQSIHQILVELSMKIDDEIIQTAEQDYGLICSSSGNLVPLKSFHVRAQIVDVTVEVIMSSFPLK